PLGGLPLPLLYHEGRGNPVEARIYLYAVEELRVEAEVLACREVGRIEAPNPVLVRPSAASDPHLLRLGQDIAHSLTHSRTSFELIRWRSSEAHGRPDVFIVVQFGVAAPVAPPSRQRSFPAARIDLPLVLDHLAGVTPLADQALSVEVVAFFNIWHPCSVSSEMRTHRLMGIRQNQPPHS